MVVGSIILSRTHIDRGWAATSRLGSARAVPSVVLLVVPTLVHQCGVLPVELLTALLVVVLLH